MHYKECPICKKKFKVYQKQIRTYCSVQCMRVGYTERLKGTNNPNYRHGPRYCKKCGVELCRNTKGNHCSSCVPKDGKNNAFFGRKHSKESLKKMRSWERKKGTESGNYGKKRSAEVCRRMSEDRRLQWINATPSHKRKVLDALHRGVLSHGNHHITKPEKFVMECLSEEGLSFKRNELMYDKFIVDFLIKSGTIIEVFGDYWHSNPLVFPNPNLNQQKQSVKDKARIAYLTKCGHEVVVIWENDIKKDAGQIRQKIKNLKFS